MPDQEIFRRIRHDDDVNRKLDLCRARAKHHRCEIDIFAARELVEIKV